MKLCGTRGAGAVVAALTVVVCAAASPGVAHGEDLVDPTSDAFSCEGEARMFVQEHSAAEIRAERDLWLAVRSGPDEPAVVTAHRWCVVAELMRSLGDDRTSQYYARAIGATGDPGYELRLADYFRIARGPRTALREQAERHYQAALAGARARAATPGASDEAIAESATRGLLLTHQQDGLTLLPWNASSLGRGNSPWPSIAVMVAGRIAVDTNDTPVDTNSPPEVDDARRFTSEAMFAASMLRKAGPLRMDELQAIARAPLRDEVMARARLRSWPIGAIDVWYRQSHVHGGEITDYRLPMRVNDIALSELGAELSRALDLAPAFDVLLAGGYHRVHRLGVVETAPNQAQDFDMFEARPTIARFLGPDKLSVALAYTVMAIPEVQGGVIADRARGRTIASLDVDYTMSRLLLPPFHWPALRVFAGGAQDDETFGIRVVRHRDAYLGLSVPRLHRWDVAVQASLFTGAIDIEPRDSTQFTGEDPQQSHAQYRTTVVLLRRLIDEDAWPGLPPETHGVRPSMLNAVVTLRHDVAIRGLSAYQNVRGGGELRAKAFVTGLRDTAVLVSVGYDNQYFYTIGKDLHVFHLDMRMGW